MEPLSSLTLLKRYFGYSSFRPGQAEIIDAVVHGRDCLVLMPTGGGKSLCFQIPALMMDGCAVVISPLIALMQDQVDALRANGVPAATVNSFNDEAANRDAVERASRGEVKLLYMSPERAVADIPRWGDVFKVNLFAIDEAHCISQWGHDFRQVYTSLKCVRERYPSVPVMALTATADRLTREDISRQLALRSPYCHIGSFDRPNISLSVVPDPGKKKRVEAVINMIRRYPNDCGIVYCLSRKATDDMDETLTRLGVRSACYHAGMSPEDRRESQRAFVCGEVNVVCATVAFGMGIDKSNIRWVIHNNIPANIESYYQEIGRAGRDGLPAEALMFYNYGDIITRQSLIDGGDHSEIFQEKLDRIKNYAESTVCRRRVLLSYFNEEYDHDCGNCDVCHNPPVRTDCTIAAQKALSAVVRTGQNIAVGTLVKILRGSVGDDVTSRGFHTIKTFGAGREYDAVTWRHYISQMIELGLLSVAYENNNHLAVTPYGNKVLYAGERVWLTSVRVSPSSLSRKPVVETLTPTQKLMEQLKKVRRKVAVEERLPDYMVFSDAALQDMATRRPTDIESFRAISGVGELKAVKYWRKFVGAIRKFEGLKASVDGATYQETLVLYNSNRRPTEIAKIRSLKLTTIYDHLSRLITDGLITDPERLITPTQYRRVSEVRRSSPDNWYEILSEEMPVGLWKIAEAIEKMGGM